MSRHGTAADGAAASRSELQYLFITFVRLMSLNLYEGRIILPSLRIVRHSRSILQYFDLAKCPLHLLAPSKVYLYLRSIYRQPGIEVYFFLTLLLTFLTSLIRER